jgi:hypothetical protein
MDWDIWFFLIFPGLTQQEQRLAANININY